LIAPRERQLGRWACFGLCSARIGCRQRFLMLVVLIARRNVWQFFHSAWQLAVASVAPVSAVEWRLGSRPIVTHVGLAYSCPTLKVASAMGSLPYFLPT
jgi:hypothetical protein